MQYDLKMIKKHYGENMAHLCRSLFPTLLEKEGLLLNLIESKFFHNKYLYDDLVYEEKVDDFKDYIYSLTVEPKELIDTGKTAKELLNDAGYFLFECKNEKDINNFKKYYDKNELLCTFDSDRLKRCFVFFAIKKNIKNIKRSNYSIPKRQDEYGTSVISIQFTRGKCNTLSIKNRYNHSVKNPDATFNNNLENIIPGLTKAFEKDYNLNINQNANDLKIDGYVIAGDGKFYFTNYELENVFYGINNVIIDHYEVQKELLDKSRYILIDIMILDMKEKKLYVYDKLCHETLPEYIGSISKIEVKRVKDSKYKHICITNTNDETTIITINDKNRMIGFTNNYIKKIKDNYFLHSAHYLKYFEARNLQIVRDSFLNGGDDIEEFIAPNLTKTGNSFLSFNSKLEELNVPQLTKVGCNFMSNNKKYKIDFWDKRVTNISRIRFETNKIKHLIKEYKYKITGNYNQ